MISIIDGNEKEKKLMESWKNLLCISSGTPALFVNAEHMNADTVKEIRKADRPAVIYAGVPWDKLRNEKKVFVFSLRTQENVGMLPGYPFSFRELAFVCRTLAERKAVDNSPVVIAVRRGLVKQILSVFPSLTSDEVRKGVIKSAERNLGICITEKEVRELLREAGSVKASSLVPPLLSNKVVRGVFCDIQGVVNNILGEVDKQVLGKLRDFAKEKKLVTLWTSGDIDNARCMCGDKGITGYPIISKRHYAGRRVELVIDRIAREEFVSKFRIFPEKYIHI